MTDKVTFRAAAEAVVDGDTATLKSLLAETPSLAVASSPAKHQANLLHYVAANGVEDELQRTPSNAVEIADLLIDAGSDPNATASFHGGGPGSTALVALVTSAHPAGAGLQEQLVQSFARAPGIKLNGLDEDGYPMAAALAFFYPKAAAALAECGAEVDNIVHAAALGRVDQVAGYLHDDGALHDGYRSYLGPYGWRIDDGEEIVQQALVYACMAGHRDVVTFLLDKGIDIDGCPHLHQTGVHLAALGGQRAVIELLIERGADTSIRDDRWDSTPLGWAAEAGQDTIRDYLVDHTALELGEAVTIGRLDVVTDLLGDDDPNGTFGGTAKGMLIRMAAHDNHLEIARFLLERGADPNLPNIEGRTALEYAMEREHNKMAQLLQEYGAQ